MSAARFAGWNPFTVLTWGFAPKASLHPRLYAFACFAGWDAHFVLKKTLAPQKSCQRKQELGGLLHRSSGWKSCAINPWGYKVQSTKYKAQSTKYKAKN
jgi:hypothetical protein